MADFLSKARLQSLTPLDYAGLRDELASGDLVFASGEYLFSRFVRLFTGSAWSHVGIIVRVPGIDRVMLLESVEDIGVRLVRLSKYFRDYDRQNAYRGEVVVARIAGMTNDIAERVIASGFDKLARPYDRVQMLRIGLKVMFGAGAARPDEFYLCSELVQDCFAESGIIFENGADGFATPASIWADRRVKLIGRVW